MVQENQSLRGSKLLTIEEICLCGHLSRPTVNRLIANKKLKAIKVGRAVRIPESAWFNFAENGVKEV